MTLYRLDELSSAELQARLAVNPTVILPFGTIEWHSYHLPIGLDNLVAQNLSEQIANQLGGVLAPLTSWAVGGVAYPHTIRFDLTLIETLVGHIFEQMSLLGFRTILALTGHFGLEQTLALKRAAFQMMRRSPITIWAGGEFEPVTDLGYIGDHAAKWETALLYAIRPDLVHIKAVPDGVKLDGILGEDPRTAPYQELSSPVYTAILERWIGLGQRLAAHNMIARDQYIEALGTGVRILEKTAAERSTKAKSQVPSLNTPHYLEYLSSLAVGDYKSAQNAAEAKLLDLAG